MFHLYDTVVLIEGIQRSGVPAGRRGTIVFDYGDGNGFEVEIGTKKGYDTEVYTVYKDQIALAAPTGVVVMAGASDSVFKVWPMRFIEGRSGVRYSQRGSQGKVIRADESSLFSSR
jgi:hypothetical protein